MPVALHLGGGGRRIRSSRPAPALSQKEREITNTKYANTEDQCFSLNVYINVTLGVHSINPLL